MTLKGNLIRHCPRTRKRMIEMRNEGKSVKQIAKDLSTSRQTIYCWLDRYDPNHEIESLSDRKSAPRYKPRKTPKDIERIVIKLRDKKGWSSQRIHLYLKVKGTINPSTGKFLSEYAIRSIFERYQRGYYWDKKKKKKPEIIRYEKETPGELVHIDVKKLSNVKGENAKKKKYEATLIDDCTRLIYAAILPDKKSKTLAIFLKNAYFYYKKHFKITIHSILSDNGKEFTWHDESGKKFHNFEVMCRMLNIKHKYTRVRRPQTNGKVERMHRTFDDELFTRIRFKSHEHRNRELKRYIYKYNNLRIHMGINGLTPMEKLRRIRTQKLAA